MAVENLPDGGIGEKQSVFSYCSKAKEFQLYLLIRKCKVTPVRNLLEINKLRFEQISSLSCSSDFLMSNRMSAKLRANPPMKTTKFLICAISIAAAVAAVSAKGQSLPVTLIDYDPQITISGTVNNGASIVAYPSGVMNFDAAIDFQAFCVQPLQDLFYGESLVYQVQDIGTLGAAEQIIFGNVARLVGGFLDSAQDAENAAAVQWAIWEITTENLVTTPLSLADGNVRITTDTTPSTIALGNQYLANINTFDAVSLTYLTNDTRQNVVTWNVIPEPSSACLMALSTLALFRRRRS